MSRRTRGDAAAPTASGTDLEAVDAEAHEARSGGARSDGARVDEDRAAGARVARPGGDGDLRPVRPRTPPRGRRRIRPVVAVGAGLATGAASGLAAANAGVAALLVAVAVVGVVVVARNPAWVVPFALAVLYSNLPVVAVRVHGLPGALVSLLVPALLAVPLLLRLVRGDPLVVPPVLVWMTLHLAVLVMATVAADVRGIAVERVVSYVTEGLVLAFLLVNVVRTRTELRRVLWALVGVGALLGALSVVQVATASYEDDYLGFAQISEAPLERFERDASGDQAPPRVSGPIGEKNRYAQVLLVLVPVSAGLAAGASRRPLRWVAGLSAVAIAGGITLTYSRGAALGLVVAVVMLVALRLLRARALLYGLVVLLVMGALFPRWVERFQGSLAVVDPEAGIEEADGSALGRASSTLGALRVFADHPVLGVGPGNYPQHHRAAAVEVGLRIEDDRQPHNLYAQVGAEAGILGLLSFGGILLTAIATLVGARRRLRGDPRTRALATGLLVALVTYLGSGMFLHLAYERYLWTLVALAAATGVMSGGPVLWGSLRDVPAVPR